MLLGIFGTAPPEPRPGEVHSRLHDATPRPSMTPAVEQIPTASGRWRLIAGQLIGLCISIACIAYVTAKVDLSALAHALLNFEWPWLVFGLVSLVLGYAMRVARWAMMLRAAGAKVPMLACVAPFLGSIALNNVLPLRAGDVVRALVFPARLGVERTTATASLLLERVMDLAALVSCLGIGLSLLGPEVRLPIRAQTVVATLSISAAVALGFMVFASSHIAAELRRVKWRDRAGAGLLHRIADILVELLERIGAMSRPVVFVKLGIESIIVWFCEAGLYFCLMKGLGIPTSVAAALTVVSTTTLSTLVPSTPGYIGPFHLAAFAAITMLGSDAAHAGAFAVLAHFTLWATTTLAGAVAILIRRDLFAGTMMPPAGVRSRTDRASV